MEGQRPPSIAVQPSTRAAQRYTNQNHVLVSLRLVAYLAQEKIWVVGRGERIMSLLLLLLGWWGVRAEVGCGEPGFLL